MNKSLPLLLGIISLTALLGAGCLGGADQTPAATVETSTEVTTTPEEETDKLFSGSFTNALALGQKITCSWSAEEGSGTAYIDGERFATIMTVDNRESSMIATSDCMYTWEIGGTDGIKMCNIEELATELNGSVTANAEAGVTTTSPNAQALADEFQDDVEVNCVAGIEDESVFTPPTNVNFIDPFAALNFSL